MVRTLLLDMPSWRAFQADLTLFNDCGRPVASSNPMHREGVKPFTRACLSVTSRSLESTQAIATWSGHQVVANALFVITITTPPPMKSNGAGASVRRRVANPAPRRIAVYNLASLSACIPITLETIASSGEDSRCCHGHGEIVESRRRRH